MPHFAAHVLAVVADAESTLETRTGANRLSGFEQRAEQTEIVDMESPSYFERAHQGAENLEPQGGSSISDAGYHVATFSTL